MAEETAQNLLYDAAPCGLVTSDAEGLITSVNRTFLEWTGHAPATIVGRVRFDELLTVPSRIFYETHYAPLLRMRGRVDELAIDLQAPRGVIPVFANAVEQRDELGRVRFVYTALMLAIQRRSYERELLLERRMADDAVKAKAELLGIVAHEVRNALNATTMTAALLALSELPRGARERVDRLQRSVGQVTALLDEMLAFSQMEAGKATLDPRSFDLGELVSTTVQTLAASAEHKRLALTVDMDARLPAQLVGDGMKIGQVLTNLISNAIKFTEHGGVHVRLVWRGVTNDAHRIEFRVEDTGTGIAADRLDAVFEPYVQASVHVPARYGGTGLGLAICQRIIELHGARLQVTSEVNRGSTFWFELVLPAVAPAAE